MKFYNGLGLGYFIGIFSGLALAILATTVTEHRQLSAEQTSLKCVASLRSARVDIATIDQRMRLLAKRWAADLEHARGEKRTVVVERGMVTD